MVLKSLELSSNYFFTSLAASSTLAAAESTLVAAESTVAAAESTAVAAESTATAVESTASVAAASAFLQDTTVKTATTAKLKNTFFILLIRGKDINFLICKIFFYFFFKIFSSLTIILIIKEYARMIKVCYIVVFRVKIIFCCIFYKRISFFDSLACGLFCFLMIFI
jgi:hypothetical protein